MFEKIKSKILNGNQVKKDDENISISLKDFSQYCKENTLLIVVTIIILGLAHGANLFYNNLGMDTKSFVEFPNFSYNWLGIGRFGLLIERAALNLTTFSSYYASVLFFIFLILSNITLYYTIYKISNKNLGLINLCIPLIAFTHPVWVEQFVYMLQIAEISMAIFITCLATLFIFNWIKNKKIISLLLGIVCMIISFASYQSFVAIYITLCVFGFLMMHENMESLKSSFITILKLISSFGVAFILYRFIISKLPANTSYIDSSFYWGNRPIEEIFAFIKSNMIDVVLGNGNYYNLGYLFGTIIFIISVIVKIIKEKNLRKINKLVWYILASVGLILTPFLMTVAIGHAPMIRAQLILPFTEAFLIMFAFSVMYENKLFKYVPIILIIYVFETQMYMTETLYYTEKMRNDSDIRMAYQIIEDLGRNGVKEESKIAIVGHQDAKLNPTCITGETVGISLFTLNYGVKPHYVHTNAGIVGLFKCLGYTYKEATVENMAEARHVAREMPVWPEEGSIVKKDDYVIIKISEDEMPLE